MSEPTALYVAFNKDGECLYVGISSNWGRRWAQHANYNGFFWGVARLEIEWFQSREEAIEEEELTIAVLQPKFNVTHNTAVTTGG